MKRALWIMGLLLALAPTAIAQDWWEDNSAEYSPITLEINAWMSKINGSVAWGGNGIPGDEINFKENAGLDSESWGPYVRLVLGLSDRWSLRLSFWHTKHTGDANLTTPLDFGGQTFSGKTSTSFALDAYNAWLGYKFIDGDQLDFLILFGAAVFTPRMEMENSSGMQVEERATIPSPQLGVGFDLTLAKGFMLRSQIVGFALDSGDANGEQFDAEGALNVTIFQGMYVTAGYKFFRVNADFGNHADSSVNKADFDIQGPFAGIGLVF